MEASNPRLTLDKWGLGVTVPQPVDLGFPILMKEIGGKWDDIFNVWRFPKYLMYYYAVKESLPDVEEDESCQALFTLPSPVDLIIHDEATRFKDLYPYQQEASDYLSAHLWALLALSPGLGKTAVSLVTAQRLGFERVLVIAPLRLLHMWTVQSLQWAQREMKVYYGIVPQSSLGWYVTNYDTLSVKSVMRQWFKHRWDLVIVDESVLIAGRNTERTKTLNMLRGTMKRVWLLSGSPTRKYYDDLWSQFNFMDPRGFTSYWRFAGRYCILEQNAFTPHPQVKGSRSDRDVQRDFPDIMFVRHQKDVLPDLPEYIFETVEVELDTLQRKAHDDMKTTFIANLEGGKVIASNKMVQMMRMSQLASNLCNIEGGLDVSAKADTIIEMYEAGAVEDPVLIWSYWVPGAYALQKRLLKSFWKKGKLVALVTGDTPPDEMDEVMERFQRGEIHTLIMSIGVGKYGHQLTAAKTVFRLDYTWSGDDYYQSMLRVRRIGLDHRPLMITLKAVHTVDELYELNLAGKMGSISEVNNADLVELLKGL